MKFPMVAGMVLLHTACFAGPIVYDPSLYTFLAVNSEGRQPGINNLGEIVYQKVTKTYRERIYSTLRGDITHVPGYPPVSRLWNARCPVINDSGEVIFFGTYGADNWSVYSTVRGRLDGGDGPSGINSFGEIVSPITQNPPGGIKSTSRGVLLNFTNVNTGIRAAINDAGEVLYNIIDTSSHVVQIYSTTRGQLTADGGSYPTINKYGDILYTKQVKDSDTFAVCHLGGARLTSFQVRKDVHVDEQVNLNDYGDFVFAVGSTNAHQVVLATQRPEFYPQYSKFDPLNLISGPRISIAQGLPIRLTLSGLVGQKYRIDYTESFPAGTTNVWNSLTNLNLPTSPMTITDSNTNILSQRFYRAVWIPDPDLW